MSNKLLGLGLIGLVLSACGGDGGNRAPAANQPPTIGGVADQTIEANTSTVPAMVGLADDRTAGGALVVAAAADNDDLLPVGSVVVSGGGASRSVVVTPRADRIGVANITLTVTDADGASATTTFALTVNRQNVSVAQLVRDVFAANENDLPRDINALQFTQDANDDDFNDLL